MARTECKLCDTDEEGVELNEHVEAHHMNTMLSLEYDPTNGHGIVHGLASSGVAPPSSDS